MSNNTFKILIATDLHLGYAENDPVRGQDCFNTFEEILQEANKNDVDFVLLGGDLFHESRASTHCLYKCMSLLAQYCTGNKRISFRIVSDQAENFRHCATGRVNYEDPNINISIPIFSIHGNHDDPSGHHQLSCLDIFSASMLINYFGKCTDLTKVDITPILMTKGSTKLALYGLSHIKDERLSRLFRAGKVEMSRPKQNTDSWFNIFVCHQNRVDRGVNKYVPEEVLPDFLHVVIWGHEHECRINPEQNSLQNFYVIQPGSPVATSLCEGESKPKHIGILEIQEKSFKLKKIPLKTVRPFVFDSIALSECDIEFTDDNVSENVQNYLEEKIDSYIRGAANQRTGHIKQPTEPLIRLRVEYTDDRQCFNTIRFGQNYQKRVANPTDIVLLRKQKVPFKRSKNSLGTIQDILEMDEPSIWEIKIEAIIEQYFKDVSPDNQLLVLSAEQISEAAACFIDKQDKDAIRQLIEKRSREMQDQLEKSDVNTDDLPELMKTMNAKFVENADISTVSKISTANDEGSDDDNIVPTTTTMAKKRGLPDFFNNNTTGGNKTRSPRAATRAARGSRARGGRGRTKGPALRFDDSDE